MAEFFDCTDVPFILLSFLMKLRLILLTLFSSALMTLAIPNELFYYGTLPTAFVALVPLVLALYKSPSAGFSSLLGVLYAMTNSFATYFWLLFFQDFSVWTCTGVALGHTLYLVLLFPIFSGLLKNGGVFRPLLFSTAWVSFEFIKSIGYIGFPWGLLAYPLENFLPLVQIADITGLWSISFIAALINGTIAEHFIPPQPFTFPAGGWVRVAFFQRHTSRRSLRLWACALALPFLVLIYGVVRMQIDIPFTKTIKIILVQQNADSWVTGREMPSIIRGQELTRQGLLQIEPDLVAWSENSFREPYYRRTFLRRPKEDPFVPFMREVGAPLLVGSPVVLDWEKRQVMNGAVLIAPDGEVLEYYGKQHPVPLAEHIPYWEVPAVRNFFQNVVGLRSAGWTLGQEYTIFEVPVSGGETVAFGVPICFEDAFPYLCRNFILQGAEILVNITNDSWSRTVSAETQHLVAARLRAIESRRVLIRSTNGGVTTIIDPFGRMIDVLPFFEEGVLTAEVPVYAPEALTPYLLYGDWFAWIMICIPAAYLLFIRIASRKRFS